MLCLLIVFLGYATSASLEKTQSLTTGHWTPHIIGGHDANEGDYPYVATLNYVGGGHACAATIVNEKWLLTAGHCCLINRDLEVSAGSIYLSKGGQRYGIDKYIVHEKYDADNYYRNDICLVKTNSSIQFDDDVKMVVLPPRDQVIETGDKVLTVGWGVTEIGGNSSDRLQVLDKNQGYSNEDCENKAGIDIYGGQICAFAGFGSGFCTGDSGGPLIFDGVQVGIASFVFIPCAAGNPDFYTRVSWYIDWIFNVMNSN